MGLSEFQVHVPGYISLDHISDEISTVYALELKWKYPMN